MTKNLKYEHHFPSVWDALNRLPRTGFLERGVKNPETVKEHIIAVRDFAFNILANSNEFTIRDKQDILDMLEVHDWPEAIVGDIVVVNYDEEKEKQLREEKRILEYEAMKIICGNLESDGLEIFNLWVRFEESEDAVAAFARQIDKYQVVEKAFEYEMNGEQVSTMEFLGHSEKRIFHPILVRKLNEIRKKVGLFVLK